MLWAVRWVGGYVRVHGQCKSSLQGSVPAQFGQARLKMFTLDQTGPECPGDSLVRPLFVRESDLSVYVLATCARGGASTGELYSGSTSVVDTGSLSVSRGWTVSTPTREGR